MSRPSPHLQADLFGAPQPDLFADHPVAEQAPRSYAPEPALVRAHLKVIVEQARQASTLPWDARKTLFYKTVVPQMTLWLPEDEAAQWRLDFETEIARLEDV
jgi:hypothetical protein